MKWNINKANLHHVEDYYCNFYDFFIESSDSKFNVYIYDVTEIRIGWEVGRFAVFDDILHPKILLNPQNVLVFAVKDCISYSRDNSLIFIKALITEDTKYEVPFIIIDFENNKFSIIRLMNSIPYQIEDKMNRQVILIEKYRDERFKSENGKVVSLDDLEWWALSEIKNIHRYYFRNVK